MEQNKPIQIIVTGVAIENGLKIDNLSKILTKSTTIEYSCVKNITKTQKK